MATVPLPVLAKDGIGAAYIPRTSRMHSTASDLLIVVQRDAGMRPVLAALNECNVSVLNTISQAGRPTALVVRPPADLLASELWQRMGISRARQTEPDFVADLSDSTGLMRRFRTCLKAADLGPMETPRRIGMNVAGSVVYETVGGRVAINVANEAHYEFDRFANGKEKGEYRDRFLRAIDQSDLRGCAAGVARAITVGESFDRRNLSRLHEDMVVDGGGNDLNLFLFQEEIEAALVVQTAKIHKEGAALRDAARELMDRTAAHSERGVQRLRLQQYSTPLTIAAVAADILRLEKGDRVLEPTAGNGALALGAAVAGAYIDGFEVDPVRADRANRVLREAGAGVVNIRPRAFMRPSEEAPGMGYDAVLANPPFEAHRSKTVEDRLGRKLALSRLDHSIVYDALDGLHPSRGRAFLVLPGEKMGEGTLEGPQRSFNNYLHATFEVAGAAMLDGRLYRKSGAEFPVIVYALGPRLHDPLSAEAAKAIPSTLPYLKTTDELFAWGDAAAAKMEQIMVRHRVWWPTDAAGAAEAPVQQAPSSEEGRPSETAAAAASRPSRRRRQEPAAPPLEAPPPEAPPVDAVPETPPAFATQEPTEEEAFAVSPDVLLDDVVFDNDPFQVTYEPASRVGGPPLKIQKALAEPVAAALLELERIRGPIDAFVAQQLGVEEADLGNVLHAGQVDGVGLALHKALRSESIIIGDLMGVGKGRQLAALARAAFKDGRPVVFFTDNASLFTDFVARDLATVMRTRPADLPQHIRPHIINSTRDASVLDPEFEGERRGGHGYVFKAASAAAKRDKQIDGSVNLILSSYSQLGATGREAKLEAIVDWIKRQDKPPLLIMDEAHKAAGEGSNVGRLLTALVEHVREADGSVAYSSGTALKAARNLKVYGSALPDVGLPADRLVELIEKEPLALQEALSYEMARSGSLIARELDNSAVERNTLSLQDVDPVRYAQVLEKVDLFANKMSELLALGREVKDWAKLREKALKKEVEELPAGSERDRALGAVGVHYQSPASRFHHLANYLTLAINGVFLEDLVLQSVAAGNKPVIAVANTGDTLMRDLIASQWKDEVEGEEYALFIPGSRHILPEKPHLGHVIKRVADRLLTVKESTGFGVPTEVRLEEYEEWLEGFGRRVDSDDFSMLSLSVIDDLAVALDKHGLAMGEITGRSFMLRPTEDGTGYAASARAKPIKQDVVSDFNNGRTDVLILNQSAAVGLSAQSSPANGFDVRRREMIKAQMQADVAQERQMDGRINRVGQLYPPLYTIPLQGLASSDRLAQMFNRKNRSLTASTTATRENESNIKDALDLLNEVGQYVCYEYLVNNPDIAETLDIDVDIDVDLDQRAPRGFAERLMGRMIALPTGMQRSIMGELDTAFQMRVGVLDALGENPLRLREYDWKAEVSPVSQLIAGNEAAQRMSERPLVLNKISYQETVKPISIAEVGEAAARGEGRLRDEITSRVMSISERLAEIAPGIDGDLSFGDPMFDRIMNRADDLRSLGAVEHNIEKAGEVWRGRFAVEDEKDLKGFDKLVIEAGRKAAFLHQLAPLLQPGAIVSVNPAVLGRLRETTLFQAAVDYVEGTEFADGQIALPGVVTEVRFNEDKPLNFGEWTVRVAVPGEERLIDLPFASAYAAVEESRKATGEGWLMVGGRIDDAGLGLARAIAPLWSPGLAESLEEAKGEPFAGSADSDLTAPPLLSGDTAEASTMRALFENVQGGKVRRTRYAVEGNLFAAVSALAGKRMGEKAMYSDTDGAIRHCFLLKKDEHKKVLEQLTKSVASRVSYIRPDPVALSGMLMGFTGAMANSSLDPSRRATYLASDLQSRLKAVDVDLDVSALTPVVLERLEKIHTDLVKAVREQGVINTGMFVGSDPFGDSTGKMFSSAASVRVREGKTDAESTFGVYHDPREITNLARALNDTGALAAFNGRGYDVIVKAKNTVCDKDKNGPAAHWTNKMGSSTLRAATVGREMNSAYDVAELLCAASKDDRQDSMIGLKGALVVYNDIMSVLTRDVAQELRATQNMTAEHQPSQPEKRPVAGVSAGV